MTEKKVKYKKICIHRGVFDQVEIGVAKIIVSKGDFFDISDIVEIELSEPFKGLIRRKCQTKKG